MYIVLHWTALLNSLTSELNKQKNSSTDSVLRIGVCAKLYLIYRAWNSASLSNSVTETLVRAGGSSVEVWDIAVWCHFVLEAFFF